MIFGIITLLTALTIAGVAAWFSIEGLMAIFSASAVPIAIMAGSLEVGKLLTASWLYRYWSETKLIMKSYLVIAVLALMLITSMGIFGYLSKAHLDQAATSGDAVAKVDRFEQLIARERGKISTAQERIAALDAGTGGTVNTSIVQQETIRDGAWERVQGDIDYNQNAITSIRTQLTADLKAVDEQLQTNLQLGKDRLAALDAIVAGYTEQGTVTTETKAGGLFSRAESETVDNVAKGAEVRASQKAERDEITTKQDNFTEAATQQKATLRQVANQEIAKLQANIDKYRAQAQTTIDKANEEINRLRDDAGTDQENKDIKIDELNASIDAAYEEIERINVEKFEAESIVRELEQEVGPIKYVAELIYGQGSEDYLDKSVRLFILLLVFVFDPLAVVLVIAANQTLLRYGINLESSGPELPNKEENDKAISKPKKNNLQHDSAEPEQDKLRKRIAELEAREPEVREVEVIKEKVIKEKEDFTFETPAAIKELEKRLQEKLNGK